MVKRRQRMRRDSEGSEHRESTLQGDPARRSPTPAEGPRVAGTSRRDRYCPSRSRASRIHVYPTPASRQVPLDRSPRPGSFSCLTWSPGRGGAEHDCPRARRPLPFTLLGGAGVTPPPRSSGNLRKGRVTCASGSGQNASYRLFEEESIIKANTCRALIM